MSLKLAIWDMDGTIVDSREVIQNAMATAFETCGLPPPPYERTRQMVGLGLNEACQQLAPADLAPTALPGLVNAYKEAFVHHRTQPGFIEPLYEGAIGSLEALARDGWLIALATGKSHRGIKALFDMHPLERFFDTIWCADDGPGKPHPFMIEQAMDALGAVPDQSLMIGDAVHDMRMARAAGVRAVGVSWGFGKTDELTDAGAHEVHHGFETLNAALARFAVPDR